MTNSITIKGTREGLTVTLGSGDLALLLEDLAQHLTAQGAFFRGGKVALQAGGRALEKKTLAGISELLEKHEMMLRTVVTTNAVTEQAARTLGLRLVAPGSGDETATQPHRSRRTDLSPVARPTNGSRGVLIRRLVRSGQVIRHTGHVVVIGDVNAGGEVIAGGDIVVWGGLYGTAHAGSTGDNSAMVCALEMRPLQLRIGPLIARPQENEGHESPRPEVARVRDNMIVVEAWGSTRRGA